MQNSQQAEIKTNKSGTPVSAITYTITIMVAQRLERQPSKLFVVGSTPTQNTANHEGLRLTTNGNKAQTTQVRKSPVRKDAKTPYNHGVECPEKSFVLPLSFGTSQASCLGGYFI